MFHCYQWPRSFAYAHCSHYAQSQPRSRRKSYYETRSSRGGGFGVRRPLRYLSYHLDLDESQRRKVAASFERLKLEQAQAKLDRKKSDTNVADVFLSDGVAVDDLRQALAARSKTEQAMQTTLAKELFEISEILDADQREEFAHLLRTGVLKL